MTHQQQPKPYSGYPQNFRHGVPPSQGAGLVEDLGAVLGESRAQQLQRAAAPLEAQMRATVKALPKTPDGCLASSSARYALHRLFVEKGWFVKGLQELDPSREIGHANVSSPVVILQDQVPAVVKALFEQRLQQTGLCLTDLALLAALLEDLVHRETMQRVSAALSEPSECPWWGKSQWKSWENSWIM